MQCSVLVRNLNVSWVLFVKLHQFSLCSVCWLGSRHVNDTAVQKTISPLTKKFIETGFTRCVNNKDFSHTGSKDGIV
jgi:hypothetical protein